MKILAFQARRFWWKSFSRTLADASEATVQDEVQDAVVAFVHAEAKDSEPERADSVFRQTLKHLKWLANKRGCKQVALHSFTHLGGENAEPQFAKEFLERLAERLGGSDYQVKCTPFGWFCEWELSVHGECLAKVWKEF
jgi:hypothetical protein